MINKRLKAIFRLKNRRECKIFFTFPRFEVICVLYVIFSENAAAFDCRAVSEEEPEHDRLTNDDGSVCGM